MGLSRQVYMTKSVDEYFCEKMVTLLPHSFIATQQAAFCTHIKETLKEGEFLVTADFQQTTLSLYKTLSKAFIGITHRQQFIHLLLTTSKMVSYAMLAMLSAFNTIQLQCTYFNGAS